MIAMKTVNIFRISALLALFAAALPGFSQNLDPTVNVSRDFELRALEAEKPSLGMEVPDSVTRFNLDFDYSVLSKPYKGAYEFTPYVLEMRPEPDAYRESRLWLRAGAGYGLHPTLDFVWSPRLQGNFRMSVYASHDSYVGRYRNVGGLLSSGSRYGAWDSDREADGGRSFFKGYELQTRIGTDGRYDWDGGCVSYDVSYLGIATRDSVNTRHYDALNVSARVRSVRDDYSYFFYDAALKLRYGVDRLDYSCGSALIPQIPAVNETLLDLRTSFGPVIAGEHAVLVDVDGRVATYGRSLSSHAANLVITPKYCYVNGRFNIKAGIRIDLMKRPDELNELLGTPLNRHKGQIVYPDVYMNFGIIEGALDLYARVGGGNDINPYSSMLERNHFFSAAWLGEGLPLLENSVERVSAMAGLRGRIGSRFSYDLNGGWLFNASAPLDALMARAADVLGLFPSICFAQYQCAFASLRLGLDTNPFDLDAYLDYKWTDVWTKGLDAIEPSRLVGGLRAEYNWNRRITVGLDCESSVNRRGHSGGMEVFVPWYLDLGADFEYRFSNGLSLWLRAGNLLHQTIQRRPGYSENGVNCTIGLSFNL